MSGKLLLIIKGSLMLAIIALALIGTVYVLDIVENAAAQEALGKIFAVLGIFTGSSLALTILANMGNRSGGEKLNA